MAMDLGGAKGGVKSDINVTPLVDVMLVLLIIMMIVAPLLQKGVDVRLPTAANTTDKPETQDQTVVAVAADKRLFVNAVQVRESELTQRVQELLENKKEKDRPHQRRHRRALQRHHGRDGYAPSGGHRGHGPHYRSQGQARPGGR